MKKMMFLSKNWYFSVQKALIYYKVNKPHHNSFILLVFWHVANFRYVANFRFLTLCLIWDIWEAVWRKGLWDNSIAGLWWGVSTQSCLSNVNSSCWHSITERFPGFCWEKVSTGWRKILYLLCILIWSRVFFFQDLPVWITCILLRRTKILPQATSFTRSGPGSSSHFVKYLLSRMMFSENSYKIRGCNLEQYKDLLDSSNIAGLLFVFQRILESPHICTKNNNSIPCYNHSSCSDYITFTEALFFFLPSKFYILFELTFAHCYQNTTVTL